MTMLASRVSTGTNKGMQVALVEGAFWGACLLIPAALEVIFGPEIAALAVALAVGSVAVLQVALVRIWLTIVGGLVTFQSQSSVLKLGYLAVTAVCLSLAIRDLTSDSRGRQILRDFRPYLVSGAVLAAYFVISLPVAIGHGNSVVDWARDASPYLSAIALPVIGLQAGLSLGPRMARGLFIFAGLISTVSFVLQWLTNRGQSGVGRVAYGDSFLSAALFCLCLAYGAGGQRKFLSQVAAACCLGSLVLTGNRSLVVLLAAFGGVVGTRHLFRMSLGAAVRSLALFTLGIGLVVQLSVYVIPGEKELLARRLYAAQTYLQTGEDQSAQARSLQARLALDQFRAHPVLGTGPGHVYTDPYYLAGVSDPRKGHRDSFVLDTPLDIPAKLGLVGTIALVAWLSCVVLSVVRWTRHHGPSVLANAMRGFFLVAVAFIPFGVTLEQKGFALTLMLFSCLMVSEGVHRNLNSAGGALVPDSLSRTSFDG